MDSRAIVLVLDGCGAGEAPDAAEYGDRDRPSTVKHVWETCGGLDAPNLARLGFFASCGIESAPDGSSGYGRLKPLSKGKDSVTGHWEMMGVVLDHPFPTYPKGFADDLVHSFENRIGRKVLGNKPASGTEIIAELGADHMHTGRPIVYTSADSVFQIACHESVVPIDELYAWCKAAREICRGPHNVQRVIARPFTGLPGSFRRTQRRKDYPAHAPHNLVDDIGNVLGIGVVSELFCGRGFVKNKRTQSNPEHAAALGEALESDHRFIFVNFEDFDMLYGHRNDPKGFGHCLEEFDRVLGYILPRLRPSDLLILTSDHGNDPTTPSTDHSREYAPFVAIGGPKTGPLGDLDGYSNVGRWVAGHLGIAM